MNILEYLYGIVDIDIIEEINDNDYCYEDVNFIINNDSDDDYYYYY